MTPLRGMRAAVVFLTRVPAGGFPYAAHELGWASAHFPAVGLGVGLVVGALLAGLQPLGALAAATLALGAQLLLTGGFHEDGLADTADALGGAYQRERVLEILKDSRVGSFGALAAAFSLLARAALLARLHGSPLQLVAAVGLVGCVARLVPVWLLRFVPPAPRPDSHKTRDLARCGTQQLLVASFEAALVCGGCIALHVLSPGRATALVAVLAVTGLVCAWRFVARLGGVTGDFLGASEQLAEVAALAVLAWA